MSLTLLAGALAFWFGAASPAVAADDAPFEFALIGDFPYTPRDDAAMPHLLEDLRDADELAFVVHLGDVHTPRLTNCTEELFQGRFDQIASIGRPFVFTPGDNDWADCSDPPLRLEQLRKVFFADPLRANGPDGFAVRSQADGDAYPEVVENAMWERGGVLFATLHMLLPSPLGPFDNSTAMRQELIGAGEAWLDAVFATAAEREVRAVFLATQADLWSVSGSPLVLDLIDPRRARPVAGLRRLQDEARGPSPRVREAGRTRQRRLPLLSPSTSP